MRRVKELEAALEEARAESQRLGEVLLRIATHPKSPHAMPNTKKRASGVMCANFLIEEAQLALGLADLGSGE